MRHPRDIDGGLPGLARWVFMAPWRILVRRWAPLRQRIDEWRTPRRVARAQARAERQWTRSIRNRLRHPATVEVLKGTPDDIALPVIMCLWNRPERIDAILHLLDTQESTRGIRLMLWNNRPSDDAAYRAAIAAYLPEGSLRSVEYHVSDVNLGGFARFFLARHARTTGSSSPVFVMLDDDEDVTPSFTQELLAVGGPRTYAGIWAWRYLGSHWDRVPAEIGEDADYVGTGGSVCDIRVVDDDRFFTRLPLRFAFLEDQWLSAWARWHGWSLRKVDTPVEFVLHETNQFPALADLKDEFRVYLEGLARGQHTAR